MPAGDASTADLGDPTRLGVLGEPKVGVRTRRDPDRRAVGRQAGGELGDRARRGDPPDPAWVGALGEPQVAVRPRRDPVRLAVGGEAVVKSVTCRADLQRQPRAQARGRPPEPPREHWLSEPSREVAASLAATCPQGRAPPAVSCAGDGSCHCRTSTCGRGRTSGRCSRRSRTRAAVRQPGSARSSRAGVPRRHPMYLRVRCESPLPPCFARDAPQVLRRVADLFDHAAAETCDCDEHSLYRAFERTQSDRVVLRTWRPPRQLFSANTPPP